ncbi:biotin-[acetyl-CoA-carboxylase] ligase [Nematocida ausubeli]|uniref:Biotin-[acetyl-CoA-carboxylase] ligase n=1 Tax=Nematocida ausubeli (strain ATCC PRA-371 / ERTm2) TaxID=1913371 RepID=H8Z9L3_NEMA1|nr:biotin-[acetyl-CoA-carboxylase] ligase [Nematocida ausubeli]
MYAYCRRKGSCLNARLLHGESCNSSCPNCCNSRDADARKGREGTNWVSSNGSLTFSILINVENHFENVSIIVSNIIKNILQREYQIDSIRVKWPNDIFLVQGQDEYKVGGVLVNYLESVSQKQASATAVIGVGINLQQCPQKSIQYKTIYEMIERPISKKELFLKLVHEIERVFSSKRHTQATAVGLTISHITMLYTKALPVIFCELKMPYTLSMTQSPPN